MPKSRLTDDDEWITSLVSIDSLPSSVDTHACFMDTRWQRRDSDGHGWHRAFRWRHGGYASSQQQSCNWITGNQKLSSGSSVVLMFWSTVIRHHTRGHKHGMYLKVIRVKQASERPKFQSHHLLGLEFGDPRRYCFRNVRRHWVDYEWQLCKISCRLVALLARNPLPDRQTVRQTANYTPTSYYIKAGNSISNKLCG